MILKVHKLLHILLAPGFLYGTCNGGDPFNRIGCQSMQMSQLIERLANSLTPNAILGLINMEYSNRLPRPLTLLQLRNRLWHMSRDKLDARLQQCALYEILVGDPTIFECGEAEDVYEYSVVKHQHGHHGNSKTVRNGSMPSPEDSCC